MGCYFRLPFNASLEKWKLHMYFLNARNTTLYNHTRGGFPYDKPKDEHAVHPIFVLEMTREGPIICPCSTKDWDTVDNRRYIPASTITDIGNRINYDNYLVEEHSFRLPRDSVFDGSFQNDFTNIGRPDCKPLVCMGVVRKKDIKG